MRHIPLSAARLDKVTAVNQLSREIEEGLHAPKEAKAWLLDIQRMPDKPRWHQVLASGVGSACFCFLFGGDVVDSMVAFLSGFVLYVYLLYLLRGRMSKIATNISGGALVTLIAVFLYQAGIGHHLDKVIIGSIIPLVPGVNFTNAIRDIADQDYIAGFCADARCAARDVLHRARRRPYYHRLPSTGRRAAAMSSDTISFNRRIFSPPASERSRLRCCSRFRGNTICTAALRALRLDLLQTDPSVYDGAVSIFFLQPCSSSFCRAASRYTSAAPVTVFLIAGIFPLVPGSGIYWTAFYVVTNDLEQAGARGFLTFKDAVAIVLGILLVFEFPQSWFRKVLTRQKQITYHCTRDYKKQGGNKWH